jgi:hypothetical protein
VRQKVSSWRYRLGDAGWGDPTLDFSAIPLGAVEQAPMNAAVLSNCVQLVGHSSRIVQAA